MHTRDSERNQRQNDSTNIITEWHNAFLPFEANRKDSIINIIDRRQLISMSMM